MPDIAAAMGKVSAETLRTLLDQVASHCDYLLWQTDTDQELEAMPGNCDPALYIEGRAFGPETQLHWQRESWLTAEGPQEGWRVVYTGLQAHCPTALQAATSETLDNDYQRQTAVVKLWGERRAGQDTWLEPRIPRRLDYPYNNKPLVGMELIQYLQEGQVAFTRYTGLTNW